MLLERQHRVWRKECCRLSHPDKNPVEENKFSRGTMRNLCSVSYKGSHTAMWILKRQDIFHPTGVSTSTESVWETAAKRNSVKLNRGLRLVKLYEHHTRDTISNTFTAVIVPKTSFIFNIRTSSIQTDYSFWSSDHHKDKISSEILIGRQRRAKRGPRQQQDTVPTFIIS